MAQAGQPGRHHLAQAVAFLAAGLTFGASSCGQVVELYPLATFLVFIVALDLWRRPHTGQPRGTNHLRPLALATLQALVTAAIALPAAALRVSRQLVGVDRLAHRAEP